MEPLKMNRPQQIKSLLLLAAAISASGCGESQPQGATQKPGSTPSTSAAPSSAPTPTTTAPTSPGAPVAATSAPTPAPARSTNPYESLRNKAFDIRVPANLSGRLSSDPGIHAFIVDWTISQNATATLVCIADGTATIHASTGGGVKSAGDNQAVREAATKLLQLAADSRALMTPNASPMLPDINKMRFTLVTANGLLSAIANVDELKQGGHALGPLANQVQVVIAAIRVASGGNPKQ